MNPRWNIEVTEHSNDNNINKSNKEIFPDISFLELTNLLFGHETQTRPRPRPNPKAQSDAALDIETKKNKSNSYKNSKSYDRLRLRENYQVNSLDLKEEGTNLVAK